MVNKSRFGNLFMSPVLKLLYLIKVICFRGNDKYEFS